MSCIVRTILNKLDRDFDITICSVLNGFQLFSGLALPGYFFLQMNDSLLLHHNSYINFDNCFKVRI